MAELPIEENLNSETSLDNNKHLYHSSDNGKNPENPLNNNRNSGKDSDNDGFSENYSDESLGSMGVPGSKKIASQQIPSKITTLSSGSDSSSSSGSDSSEGTALCEYN